jgi:hypothetical protein
MDRNDRMDDRNDTSTRRSTADDVLRHDEPKSTGDEVGEAVGGISGVLTGAALGSLGGPIGTIIGGVAGAVSGWWAGRAISEAASHITDDDESAYRTHYESSSSRLADRSYDDVRPAYQLGHLAGRNPEYAGREFEDVERDLQHGWTNDVSSRHGDWQSVRGYARDAYSRGRTGTSGGAAASTAAGSAAYGAGRTADTMDSTTDRVGDKMENAADRAGDKLENAWDKTKQGASNLGDKIERGVDNLKDRVDGNPNSRPGPDSTDRNI